MSLLHHEYIARLFLMEFSFYEHIYIYPMVCKHVFRNISLYHCLFFNLIEKAYENIKWTKQ